VTALTEEQEQLVEIEQARPQEADRAPIAEQKTFRPYEPDQVLSDTQFEHQDHGQRHSR